MATPRAHSKPASPDTLEFQRPHGRSLGDFGELSPAEKILVDCCRQGTMADIAKKRPGKSTKANRVRASFVRFLALGGDERAPVHEYGISLSGAWVTGILDISAANVERRVGLFSCRIERINAIHSSLKGFNLAGSRLIDGFLGDRLQCRGGLFFRDGFHATGEIRLLGASIDGNLDFNGARLEAPARDALAFDGATISGHVMLKKGFHSLGRIRLSGAVIAGNLECQKCRFDNGDMEAFVGDRARVNGMFFFRDVEEVTGEVSLALMHVGSLNDDPVSWEKADGRLVLDGFVYDRIVDEDFNIACRVAWLLQQKADHLMKAFRTQPWEQLIAVLRSTGLPDEARAVAIAKHEQMRKAGRFVGRSRTWDWLYGALVGYGYKPRKLVNAALGVWLVCALAYWAAVNPDAVGSQCYLLGPSEPDASAFCPTDSATPRRGPQPGTPRYQDFFAPTYSLEVLLPVISLGSKEEWRPMVSDGDGNPLFWGHMLRFLYWFEIAFGWVAGLLLVGLLGNLVKKD